MPKEEIEKIMREVFEQRKGALGTIPYDSKVRAFAVAGEDLIYDYMKEVISKVKESDSR